MEECKMSIVIAVKDKGRVMFGADTQITTGNLKYCPTSESNLKITKMPHGILIGRSGLLNVANILTSNPKWFAKLSDEDLSKRFLVERITPRLAKELKDNDLLYKEGLPGIEMEASFLIAQKDKLFFIHQSFAVFEVPFFSAIGSGSFGAEATFNDETDHRCTREQILSALKNAAAFDTSVSAPFVLTDTEKLEYEFVEENQ